MTTITLTPDIEKPLTEQARQQGTTPELLALDGLRKLFAAPQNTSPAETLYDFLQGYVGTVEGTTEALSENTSSRFAEGLANKQKDGTLWPPQRP